MAILLLQKRTWTEGWNFVRPEGLLIVLLVVGALLSCIGAFWPKLAVETTLTLVKIGFIYFAIANLVDSPSRLRIIISR
jgi:hypothetical protein